MNSFISSIRIFLLIFLFFPSSISFSQTGFIMGSNGLLLKTSDGGSSWYSKPTGTTKILWESYFINDQTGWIAGGNYDQTGMVIKTTDQGETWTQQFSTNSNWLTNIWFINSQTGFAVGSSRKVIRTTNGGNNWDSISIGAGTTLLETIFFPDSITGYLTGWGGLLYKSTNGGNSWFALASNTTNNLYASYFVKRNYGFVAGSAGTILKTTDGSTWVSEPSGISVEIFSIYFYNIYNGWAVGHNGTIVKSTDKGNTWFPQTSGTTTRLEIVDFINELTGWIAGGYDGSVVLKTTNGGNNWFSQNVGYSNNFYSAWFFTQPLKVNNKSNSVPNEFKLYQNYPNPFNPSTKIKYQVEKSGFINLKVFDVLGKEITTIVNERKNPGIYEVEWDAGKFPSGMYFYKIEVRDSENDFETVSANNSALIFSETRKLILIK